MTEQLRRDEYLVNRKHIQRLMREMGLEAICHEPRLSEPHPGHKIYPYLLRNVVIDRKDQVWTADITDISLARGFMYLVAIIYRLVVPLRPCQEDIHHTGYGILPGGDGNGS